MMKHYKLSQVIGILTIISCTEIWTMGYTFRQQNRKLTLKPERELTEKLMISTDLSADLMKEIDQDIKRLKDTSNKPPYTESSGTMTKSNERYVTSEDGKPVSLFSITKPTNTRKVLLYSKNRLLVKMNKTGELMGTRNMSDPDAVFIIESMSRGVVRLKGKRANKYICIDKKGKIVIREKPISKCLLRQYLEENFYQLFWSYKFSSELKGENGWFLALKKNGKMKQPLHTKLGQETTMFHVVFLNGSTFKMNGT